MYYKLSVSQENEFLDQPETGMGYQIVESFKTGSRKPENFLVLNSEIAIEMKDGSEIEDIRTIMNKGIFAVKAEASVISLTQWRVLNKMPLRNSARDFVIESERGAIEKSIKKANGVDMFVRLSAFDNDRRVDKINKCLLPGSFATTDKDCHDCRVDKDDPTERYALPNSAEIKYAFYIQPSQIDTLQIGKVQPDYGKQGGGREVYFKEGTTPGSFKGQINHF